jgi:putative resolvase
MNDRRGRRDSLPSPEERVAIYARVSSHEHRDTLQRQAERLSQYCIARGYQVAVVVKEIASGVNDSRPKLTALLSDRSITRLAGEHKDRLTRFGFRYIELLMQGQDAPRICQRSRKR